MRHPQGGRRKGTVKRSVSIPRVIYDAGLAQVERRGYASFSHYIRRLIFLDCAASEKKSTGEN